MMKKAIGLALALVMLTVPAYAKDHMRRYKILTSDGGESYIEGTKLTVNGVYVLIWIGKVIDTVVTAPKYVTEVPIQPEAPKAKKQDEGSPGTQAPHDLVL